METMNEKKATIIQAYLGQSKEVMKKLAFNPTMKLGQYVIQRKEGYGIVRT